MVRTVIFDKTGTLTRGEPSVTDVLPVPGIAERELLAWAATAEIASEHPLGEAIVRAAGVAGVAVERPESFQAIPGHGVAAGWRRGGGGVAGSQDPARDAAPHGASWRRGPWRGGAAGGV